jgi:hypothetical protein
VSVNFSSTRFPASFTISAGRQLVVGSQYTIQRSPIAIMRPHHFIECNWAFQLTGSTRADAPVVGFTSASDPLSCPKQESHLQLAELTEVETGFVYTFNVNKIYAVVRQPTRLVIDDSPAWGNTGTFVYGIDNDPHIAEEPDAFLERIGIAKEFVYFGEARWEDKPIKLWLRASAVSHLTDTYFRR